MTVAVVNYNGGPRLRACLESLLADGFREKEILLVDNASTDGSLDGVGDLLSESAAAGAVAAIRSPANAGYAAAVNAALARARGEFLAVLNMDLVVEPGWLEPLVALLRSRPKAGAAGPLVLLADGSRVNAAGQDVHVTGLGFNRGLGSDVASAGTEPFEVGGIHGSAFLVRREDLSRLGGMDEAGFLYHEDVNLSWLYRLAGYDLWCVPASRVRHDYFLSMYPEKFHLLERNRVALLLAYLRPATLAALSPALLLTEAMAWGFSLLRGPRFLSAKGRSYAWVLSHRREIAARRRLAASLRTVGDGAVLERLRWAYSLDQFLTLGRERGPSAREPEGGLRTPKDAG